MNRHLRSRIWATISLAFALATSLSAVEPEGWIVQPSATLVLDGFADAKRSDDAAIAANYATKYGAILGYVALGATAETDRLGLWSGGTAFASVEAYRARMPEKNLPPRVFGASDIEAENAIQLRELWYEQRMFDERVRVIVGRQYGECEFGFTETAGDFPNAAFPLNPTVTLPAYPDPALGVAIISTPLSWLQLGGGFWAPPDEDYIGLVEAVISGDVLRIGETVAKFGYWRHESTVEYLVDASANGLREASNNWGVYGSLEQAIPFPISREAALFGQFGITPEARNGIARFYSGGIVLTGVSEYIRPDDSFGFAIAHVAEGGSLRLDAESTESETSYEWYWRFAVTDWLGMTADMSYSTRSGVWATGDPTPSPSSQLTVGLRLSAVFNTGVFADYR